MTKCKNIVNYIPIYILTELKHLNQYVKILHLAIIIINSNIRIIKNN